MTGRTSTKETDNQHQEKIMSQDTQGEASPRVMLTLTEAAERLSIGRTTIYELLASGALESVYIGKLRRIPLDCLVEFVERCRREHRIQIR